ncbi:phosphatidylserine decarboxylase [Thiohalocapsa marina]|uniref:Phosphatidylserine decarboxylase n=1 Tax=Thiohalocapsa marina TaxID=424902 RepID=A0A5M8FRL8_9GAMM|nr:phosphatidylserine decarboxylase [Thiohalocapsa marina]KAA6186211.1 phosphatidylserine decarboxylase [Thiohalocapsa marina]
MMRRLNAVRALALVVLAVGLLLLADLAVAEDQQHRPITRELVELIAANPEIGTLLEASIAAAKDVNPDPATNPVQTLSAYFDFIDSASQMIPRQTLDDPPNLIRDQILQSICYFYFLVDQPLEVLADLGHFSPTLQFYPPFAAWLGQFTETWGDFLDTEASWSEETYQQFYADPRFGLQQGWYESPENWRTFNQFFARKLRSPEQRPIAAPNDPAVVVAPADSVPHGVWAIDGQSRIQVPEGLRVKLSRYFSIPELLGPDSAFKEAFAGGVLTHTFLNVNDYHHYHFAVGGTVKEKRIVRGNTALEVEWNAAAGRYDPVDSMGWQFTHTRGYVIVDTGDHGLVALIPMGMAQVSSVNFYDAVQVGSRHDKGDELGFFLFGGSDFVMLFQPQAGFELTAPRASDDAAQGSAYAHLLMGEAYGILRGRPQGGL